MRWYEHRVTDGQELASKLIKRKFGMAGYGMWCGLQEVIATNIEGDNIDEWGFVSTDETMDTLSEKIGCTAKEFREFVDFCDETLILERRNNRLFCQFVVDRKNEYARKIQKKDNDGKSGKTENPENPRNIHNTAQSHTQHSTITYTELSLVTNEACASIASEYSVSLKGVMKTRQELDLYCRSHKKTYKDYYAALQEWVQRRIDEGKLAVQKSPLPVLEVELSPEEVLAGRVKLAEIRAKAPMKNL